MTMDGKIGSQHNHFAREKESVSLAGGDKIEASTGYDCWLSCIRFVFNSCRQRFLRCAMVGVIQGKKRRQTIIRSKERADDHDERERWTEEPADAWAYTVHSFLYKEANLAMRTRDESKDGYATFFRTMLEQIAIDQNELTKDKLSSYHNILLTLV